VHLGQGADGQVPPRVGFVVSRAVGPAVVRNRVRRRLREILRNHVPELPMGALLVVRANPSAAAADTAELRRDLERALERALAQVGGYRTREESRPAPPAGGGREAG
jgi:ribonuclease P protein component